MTTTGEPGTRPHRDRGPAVGAHLRRQRQRDRHHLGHPGGRIGGSYPITITATNASGTTTQAFTLTNSQAPTITSAATADFYSGTAGTYTVTTTGFPAATITEAGTLPAGLTLACPVRPRVGHHHRHHDGRRRLLPGDHHGHQLLGVDGHLALTITVARLGATGHHQPATADFNLGKAGEMAVTTTGGPTPTITESGALPAGLSFVAATNGTALISGTPTATGDHRRDRHRLQRDRPRTQTLSIVVDAGPAITSAASGTMIQGVPGAASR